MTVARVSAFSPGPSGPVLTGNARDPHVIYTCNVLCSGENSQALTVGGKDNCHLLCMDTLVYYKTICYIEILENVT